MRKLRVTPRKHGRHLSICPEDAKADTNYFILLLCCLSDFYQQRHKFWNKSDIRPLVYDAVSAIKVCLTMSIQATKRANVAFIKHDIITRSVSISSLSLSWDIRPHYHLSQSAATVSIWPWYHSILKPAAPSSAITTYMSTCTKMTSAPVCLSATHLTIMPFRIIALWANSS